jgi:hypothetical protein
VVQPTVSNVPTRFTLISDCNTTSLIMISPLLSNIELLDDVSNHVINDPPAAVMHASTSSHELMPLSGSVINVQSHQSQ